MTRRPRNPRRAYDHDGREIPPMTLGNMREHGVRSVAAHCQVVGCGHSGTVNADNLPDDFPVPDVALRLRCSACGSRPCTCSRTGEKTSWLGTSGWAT